MSPHRGSPEGYLQGHPVLNGSELKQKLPAGQVVPVL